MSNDDSFCAEIIWKIQNFSCCWHKEKQAIFSPIFTLDVLQNTKWYLGVYPKGYLDLNSVAIFLLKKDCDITSLKIGKYLLSLMKEETELMTKMGRDVFDHGNGFPSFVTHVDMLAQQKSYLPEDVLTLRCRIWPDSQVSSKLKVNKQNLSTCLEVKKFPFTWKIKNFSHVSAVPSKIVTPCLIPNEGKSATVTLFYFAEVERIEIHITGEISKVISWKCVFKLFNAEEYYLLCDDDISEKTNEKSFIYTPLVNRTQILQNRDQYLINDELSLDCQLVFTSHELRSSIESNLAFCNSSVNSVWFSGANAVDRTFNNRKCSTSCNDTSTDSSLKQLQLNVLKFYKSGHRSDFSLEVESEVIPVHSFILCAQSPVFETMLECNMKEKKDRSVKIEDLDLRTTRKMLDYIYTEEISDLDVELCLNLYYAEDKYEMAGLKSHAADFLKMHLSVANVYDVLVLADRYNDQELKSCVLQFILQHEKEIILSEDFKGFVKENAQLGSETLITLSEMRLN